MKAFKEKNAGRILWLITLVIIALVLLKSLTSCTVTNQSTKDLLTPNYNDRIVVGYSKNMKWYKVVDQKGISRTDIRIDSIVRPVGSIFISKSRNIYCRY